MNEALKEGFATRKQGIRYALIGLGVIAVLLVVAFPVRHFIMDPNTGTTKEVPAAAPTTVPEPALTSLQQVRAAFAPWQLVSSNGSSQAPNLLMLNENGSVEVAGATVDFQPQDWTSTKPFEIRTVSVHESGISISTSGGKIFTVAVEQPFILSQEPQYVYLITSDGEVWQAPTKAVRAMQS